MCTCTVMSGLTIFVPAAIGCLGLAFLLYGRNRPIRRIGAMLTGALGSPMAWLAAIFGGINWNWHTIPAEAPPIAQVADVFWWSFQHSTFTLITIFLIPIVVIVWSIAADTGVDFFDARGYSGSRFFAKDSKSQEVKVGCVFCSIGFLVLLLLTTPLLSVVGFLYMELTYDRASFDQMLFTTNFIASVLLALALIIVGLLTVNAFETEQSMQETDESDSTLPQNYMKS